MKELGCGSQEMAKNEIGSSIFIPRGRIIPAWKISQKQLNMLVRIPALLHGVRL